MTPLWRSISGPVTFPPVSSSRGAARVSPSAPPRRTFPYFACTPEGYRRDCPGGEPGVSKFRFLVVED